MNPNLNNSFKNEMIKGSRYRKFQDFHNLMPFRIRDILLVSSLYDSYVFEEDGRLYELIRKEYQGLNLSHSPELIQCSSGHEAIEMAKVENRFNLIIATQHIDDMSTIDFADKVRKAGLKIPLVLLGYDNREMADLLSNPNINLFDKVFIWQGDFRIIFGIVKYLEDKINIEHDTHSVGVQSIILIEDSIKFYSSFLPIIYTEILKQSQTLISEGINLSHKFLRMRARPKIILCSNYEEAWNYYQKYKDYVLGIISDIDFERNNNQDPRAGIIFVKNVKKAHPDIPVLLQSNNPENQKAADSIGAAFILKESPTLLQELTKFIKEHFSFGDFIFRDEEGNEVGRAKTLLELEEQLALVPEESIKFHASRNHFSNWLKARTEFWLAYQLRPKKVSDFKNVEELRQVLIDSIKEFRKTRAQGVITDFSKETFGYTSTFSRIGGGSIGGKARGLGFLSNMLSNFEIRNKFDDVEIFVPPLVVVGTDVFDEFLEVNNLFEFALKTNDDNEIIEKFVDAPFFPKAETAQLKELLEIMTEPLAVRSSSLLEDSQGQPFAGVYETLMLPNCHPDVEVRLKQLIQTIKRVYASSYLKRAKEYIKVTSYRMEEEKMAVIIQKAIGNKHGNKFYPEISGVAKSYNFYPVAPLKSRDGIVSVALGLGKTIVDGGSTVRFCPKYPNHSIQNASLEDFLNNSQKDFFAIELNEWDAETKLTEDVLLKKYNIDEADKDGTLTNIASTYSIDNDTIYDGTSRQGTRVFTLAPLLKYKYFKLPEILNLILELGSWGMSAPVELEFAVNLSVNAGVRKKFAVLQMRPLVISNELVELEIDTPPDNKLICRSDMALGNGIENNIYDLVFVDRNKFDRAKSKEVAEEISNFNSKLVNEGRKYLLIGVGRWGTMDPWLGIPVVWSQINGAKAIVESNFKNFNVAPSQGTHFFQNLTSFKVGYFTVDDFREQGFIDWNWLLQQKTLESKKFTKHIRLDEPICLKINGQLGKGLIYKPGANNK